LIEIINKQLLLQLVGYLCYWQMGFNSVFKGLISLNVRVNVDAFRMNILKLGICGMMSDVVASSAVKVTGNHSAFVLYVICLRQIITQQKSHVASTCTETGILVPSKKQNSFSL